MGGLNFSRPRITIDWGTDKITDEDSDSDEDWDKMCHGPPSNVTCFFTVADYGSVCSEGGKSAFLRPCKSGYGTGGYGSIESEKNPITRAADLYALGVSLLKMYTGSENDIIRGPAQMPAWKSLLGNKMHPG